MAQMKMVAHIGEQGKFDFICYIYIYVYIYVAVVRYIPDKD